MIGEDYEKNFQNNQKDTSTDKTISKKELENISGGNTGL